ncbi:Protein TRANSPARENT TESTA 12 [Acorus calamus]|uniref:Protein DETOXIFICATION n=1 Tax=Acorus calamus TaxID=4465 RepID=A0AAV9ESE4_ACOCL|nr:Protein TRANSPARENT TESTA 12 [Acorus calamus]
MEKDLKEKLIRRGGDDQQEEEETLVKKILVEQKKLWKVAGPGIFTRFSTFGLTVISQAFIGHIGAAELAAYALIGTVVLRFANGVMLGMASALETLCGQAYGAKQYNMLGIYLQRSWIIVFSTSIFLIPLFVFAEPILMLLGQDPSIASTARTISLWFIPLIFSYAFSFTFQMYLQAQSKNIVIAYLAALSLSLHVLLSWLLGFKLQLGLAGVMSSMILAAWIPIFGQMAFVFCGGCPLTWTGFSTRAFEDLWPVLKLSLSSGAMLCLELWYNTILVLLTGNMKNAQTAIDALSICININGWEMMISLGFLAAASVRVSNELGRGSAKAAKFAVKVVATTSLTLGVILFVVFLVVRERIAYLFTKETDVVEAVGDLSPLLAFSILMNSVQPVLSGVAVGAGWQSVVAYVNIACYYLVGIPLGVLLGFLIGYQVKGIWIGMMLGTAVQTIVLVIITWRTDWDKQVNMALARVNKWIIRPAAASEEDPNGITAVS